MNVIVETMHVISCRSGQVSVGVIVKREEAFDTIRYFPALHCPSCIVDIKVIVFLSRWTLPLQAMILHTYIYIHTE